MQVVLQSPAVGISAANFTRQDFGTSHGSSKIQLIPISVVCGGRRRLRNWRSTRRVAAIAAGDRLSGQTPADDRRCAQIPESCIHRISGSDPNKLNEMKIQKIAPESDAPSIDEWPRFQMTSNRFMSANGHFTLLLRPPREQIIETPNVPTACGTTPYSGLPPVKVLLGIPYASSNEAEAGAASINNCSTRLNPCVIDAFSRRR